MKALTNSAVKLLAAALFVATAASSIAGDSRFVTSQAGSGYSKGDAIASAFMKLPYGSKVKGINVNGISTYKFVKGAGYVQIRGGHTANIIYSR